LRGPIEIKVTGLHTGYVYLHSY